MTQPVVLIADGRWKVKLAMHLKAAPSTGILLSELLAVLNKMATGLTTWREEGAAPLPAIVVGTYDEWPELAPADPRPSYLVKAVDGRILVLAATPIMLVSAVWCFASTMGYQMLTPTWEVYPRHTNFTSAVDHVTVNPVLFVQGLGDACGVMPSSAARLAKWRARNGLHNDRAYDYGHAWGAVLAAYPTLPKSKVGNKLFVRDPATMDACVARAKARIHATPNLAWVSMSASDGTQGWTEVSPPGTSPATQQVELANHVQSQLDLDPECRGVRVAIMAYGLCSRKPAVRLNPRLAVVVPNGYIQDGRTYEQVEADYRAMGATTVVPYSYLSVPIWAHGAPGRSRASRPELLTQDARRAGKAGLACEAASSWGPDGHGYWLLARLLTEWKCDSSFSALAFQCSGPAMQAFYELISVPQLLTSDLIHRMYSLLHTGLKTATDSATIGRVYDLVMYARYCELLLGFENDPSVATMEPMLEWMNRIKERDLVAYRCAYGDSSWAPYIRELEQVHNMPLNAFSLKPDFWNKTEPTPAELDDAILFGMTRNALMPFEPVGYSDTLRFVSRPIDRRPALTFASYATEDHSWQLWMQSTQSSFIFTSRAGLRVRDVPGYIRIVEPDTGLLVKEVVVPGDAVTRQYSVPLAGGMLYRVDIDPGSGLDIDWLGFAMTRLTDLNKAPFLGQYGGYFLVPAGTTDIGGFCKAAGAELVDPSGAVRLIMSGNRYFKLSVTASADDQIWAVRKLNGTFGLLTVPRGLAKLPGELLVP